MKKLMLDVDAKIDAPVAHGVANAVGVLCAFAANYHAASQETDEEALRVLRELTTRMLKLGSRAGPRLHTTNITWRECKEQTIPYLKFALDVLGE